jgi:hypothetical protein
VPETALSPVQLPLARQLRVLLLDHGTCTMLPGDVVVQLGNWHGWCNPNEGSLMAFMMMGAKYED